MKTLLAVMLTVCMPVTVFSNDFMDSFREDYIVDEFDAKVYVLTGKECVIDDLRIKVVFLQIGDNYCKISLGSNGHLFFES